MKAGARSFATRLLRWCGWPLLLAPLTIFLHELGHFLAAVALGFPDPQIHFSAISHGDVSGRPAWQSGVVGLAGPAVTAAFVFGGLALTFRAPRLRFGWALAFAAASRFFVGVPYTIANLIALASGRRLDPPAFDEYKAGEALGWSGDATLAVSSLLFFAVLLRLALGVSRGQRTAGWLGLIVGTVAGWAAWFAAGPYLLP